MRKTVEREVSEKALILVLFYIYPNLFLTQTLYYGDKGKIQNLSFTLASTAKLTTPSRL